MDQGLQRRQWTSTWSAFRLLMCMCALDRVLAQVRYSVNEERDHGAFVVDGVPESLSDLDEHALSRRAPSNLALYLIVSLSVVSLIFLVAIIVLAALKCYKDRDCPGGFSLSSIGSTCCTLEFEPPAEACKKSNLNMQISTGTKVPTNCVENSTGTTAQNYCYKVCLTPESAKSDFMFMKSYSPSTPRNNAAKETENLAWSSQSRASSANNGATTPNE
ncbi:protocadherin beta-15, partial [Tachysurus ichikawai]